MLYTHILDAYKEAMKAHDDSKKWPLNYVIAQIKNKQIETQKEITDEEVVALIKKEIKARQESLVYLEKAGNQDAIQAEKDVIVLLSTYVPEMLSKEQLQQLVKASIEKQGITDVAKQRWEIVKDIMADHKPVVDGRLLQEVIGEFM